MNDPTGEPKTRHCGVSSPQSPRRKSAISTRATLSLLFVGCLVSTFIGAEIGRRESQARHLEQLAVLANEPPPIFLPATPSQSSPREKTAPLGCELRRNSRDGKTIELWHDGELSSEIEPRDGVTFRVLDEAMRNGLSFFDVLPALKSSAKSG